MSGVTVNVVGVTDADLALLDRAASLLRVVASISSEHRELAREFSKLSERLRHDAQPLRFLELAAEERS